MTASTRRIKPRIKNKLKRKTFAADKIADGYQAMDIGKKTRKLFAKFPSENKKHRDSVRNHGVFYFNQALFYPYKARNNDL